MDEQRPMRSREGGFTLIELLVVIAIIAILAAIAMPVFVQAKASISRHISIGSAKQTSLGILGYLTDSEELFPLGMPVDGAGRYLPTEPIAVPASWDGFPADDSVAWINSTEPYRKDYKVLMAHGLPEVQAQGYNYVRPLTKYFSVNLTYNGLLQSSAFSSVASPAKLTLVWQGEMKANVKGYTRSRPLLRCTGALWTPCQFNPDAMPQLGASPGPGGRADSLYRPFDPMADTFWVYGKGMIFCSVDGSAHYREVGVLPEVQSYEDPGAKYDPVGRVLQIHRCRSNAYAPYYSSFFRPDSEFDYPFGIASAACRR